MARSPSASPSGSRRPSTRHIGSGKTGVTVHTVAYVPSPSFSSCWKLLGCRLSITSTFRSLPKPNPRLSRSLSLSLPAPRLAAAAAAAVFPPRLLTEMLLSVRSFTLSVPTCVGCRRISGGSRVVNLGSQSVARAVVRVVAMESWAEAKWVADVGVVGAELVGGCTWACEWGCAAD